MLGDAIVDVAFVDVFAGTGIVGMEALSRGAAKATFIERDRRQVALIKRNLDHVGLAPQASVRGSDAFVWGKHFVPEPRATIVFLGPPYPDFEKGRERMLELVADIQGRLRPEDILVLQFPRFVKTEELPGGDGWYRLRAYGKTRVGLWSSAPATMPSDEDVEESNEDAIDDETGGATDEEAGA